MGWLLLVLAVVLWWWWGRQGRGRRRPDHGAVPATTRSLVTGARVWLEGEVQAIDEPLRAPIGGTACVYWRLGGPADEEERQDFALVEATGRVVVEAAEADWLLLDGTVDGALRRQAYVAVGAQVTVIGEVEATQPPRVRALFIEQKD